MLSGIRENVSASGAGKLRVSGFDLTWLIGVLALLTVSVETHAQDLEPRAYPPTPVGLNFLIGGDAYAKGAVGTNPSVPIEDAEVELNSAVLAYVRTLDLWGRSGKIDLIVPYTWADESPNSSAKGVGGRFLDSTIREFILHPLYGAPALSFEQFRDYEPDIIIGTSLEVTPPLGQYDSDKLLNIGTNRWSFKPELGISKTLGPLIWSSRRECVSTLTTMIFLMVKPSKSAQSTLSKDI